MKVVILAGGYGTRLSEVTKRLTTLRVYRPIATLMLASEDWWRAILDNGNT